MRTVMDEAVRGVPPRITVLGCGYPQSPTISDDTHRRVAPPSPVPGIVCFLYQLCHVRFPKSIVQAVSPIQAAAHPTRRLLPVDRSLNGHHSVGWAAGSWSTRVQRDTPLRLE